MKYQLGGFKSEYNKTGKLVEGYESRIKELEQQIEDMKCCCNCGDDTIPKEDKKCFKCNKNSNWKPINK